MIYVVQDYAGQAGYGVFRDRTCKPIGYHAFVIVGYGTASNGLKFWKIKNSWGPKTGIDGYLYLERIQHMWNHIQFNTSLLKTKQGNKATYY